MEFVQQNPTLVAPYFSPSSISIGLQEMRKVGKREMHWRRKMQIDTVALFVHAMGTECERKSQHVLNEMRHVWRVRKYEEERLVYR